MSHDPSPEPPGSAASPGFSPEPSRSSGAPSPTHEPVSASRRVFLSVAAAIAAAFPAAALGAGSAQSPESTPLSEPIQGPTAQARRFADALADRSAGPDDLTVDTIQAAEIVAGCTFTPAQRELMLEDLRERLADFEALRAVKLDHSIPPSIVFDPRIGGERPRPVRDSALDREIPDPGPLPSGDEDIAYSTLTRLAGWLRSRQLTSRRLTEIYLERLRRFDEVLHAVVTLTPERALAQARAADAELDAGLWRGPLHGIPWGAKDLLAVRGYPTTWGAMPYRDQVIDTDASVVERLDAAGAVLVAKLTLGALAWGDVWFGGMTRNPWNPDQGSSGSSAGPGSAVSAGLVGFAIGSETLGSIVSPSTRNGVTGLRPTFGVVSRHGAMPLSWTMDKLGPMARSAECCELVFQSIAGHDERDPASVGAGYDWLQPLEVSRVRVGYLADAFEGDYDGKTADEAVLETLRGLGFDPKPVVLPDLPVGALTLMLNAEAAAAFSELSASGGTDTMVRQERNAWPNVFRHARLIPAVDYINASRVRTLLSRQMATLMSEWDVLVTPSFRGSALTLTNLSGHPSITMPNRFDPLTDDPASPRRRPGSITLVAGLYRDDLLLSVAKAWQGATGFHRLRPPIR